MRRGSLSERTIKCSKPGCACAQDPKARHGPYYSLTRAVGGKTRSRFLTPEQAALARQQIEAGHAFRTQLEAYWQDCEDWADRQLHEAVPASAEEAEKGGSRRPGKRNRPGNRSALRSASGRRTGLRSPGDGGTTASAAFGRPRPGTTPQRGYERSCGSGVALCLRRLRPVSWPSREDLRKRPRVSTARACLLSLCALPARILSA